MVNKEQLKQGLSFLGVTSSMQLIMHSSLKSFGTLEGGAQTLLDTLQELITQEGTLMLPTFTYGYDPFEKNHTPSKTGFITEVFRMLPNVYRSGHPTHSVAIWGKNAKEWADCSLTESPFAEETPLRRLLPNGYVLLVGVDYTACSMIHVGQQFANNDYLQRPKRMVEVVNPDSSRFIMSMQRAGCSRGFNKISPSISQETSTFIGPSKVILVKASLIIEATINTLSKDRDAFYCGNPICPSCSAFREVLKNVS